MKLHLRATGVSLTILDHTGYLTQVNISLINPSQRSVLDLPTPEGWKAELT